MRLIDADILIEMCHDQAENKWNQITRPYSWTNAYEDFATCLEEAPTIDAESLRPKGEWKYAPDYAEYCSICEHFPDEEANHNFNFCPNCGADMRGEK